MAINSAQIEEQLNLFLELQEDSGLVRMKELGADLCFEELRIYASPLKKLFSRILSEVDWNITPNQVATKFQNELNELSNSLKAIQTFNTNQGNQQSKNQNITTFTNAYSKVVSSGAEIVSYNGIMNPAIESAEEALKATEGKLKEELKKAKVIVSNIEDASGEAGVSKYAKSFANISEEYGDSSKIWLGLTILSIIILIFGGIFVLERYGSATETAQIVNNTISKIILLTGLIYFVTLCLKNYKANKHNEIVNRHKATALSTFKVFIDAADENDPQTLNAILLEATKTIFSATNSGFLSHGAETSDLSPKVIEIFKGINNK